MIDVHCHLNFHAFKDDVDEAIQRAREKGVSRIINTGTKLDSSAKAVELAHQYEDLYAIVGVHPHHADKKDVGFKIQDSKKDKNEQGMRKVEWTEGSSLAGQAWTGPADAERNEVERASAGGNDRQDPNEWIAQLEVLARQPKVVGIGEVGLDYFSYQSNGIVDPALQKEVFEAQIELAHRVGLPLQIHGRHAGKDILEILRHHKNLLKTDNPGMFHCFAGDFAVLKGALDLGFSIGFDGNSTYKGLAPGETVALPDIAKTTPLDRIVTETDSPFLTPMPLRGSRNEPSYVILVGEFLAKVKGVTFTEFDEITTQNAKRLFNIRS